MVHPNGAPTPCTEIMTSLAGAVAFVRRPSSCKAPLSRSTTFHSTAPSSTDNRRGRRKKDATKMLWVDKHRPKSLDSLDVHPELTTRLVAMVSGATCSHCREALEGWRMVHHPRERKRERCRERNRGERSATESHRESKRRERHELPTKRGATHQTHARGGSRCTPIQRPYSCIVGGGLCVTERVTAATATCIPVETHPHALLSAAVVHERHTEVDF